MNWKQMMAMVGSGLIGGLLATYLLQPRSALATTHQIAAQEFLVVDAEGNARGSFGLTNDGLLRLAFQDAQGERRLVLSLTADAIPSVGLFGKNGSTASVTVARGSEPTMALTDAQHHRRAVMYVSDDGQPILLFSDKREKPRVNLLLAEDKPILALRDEAGKVTWSTP